MISMEVKAIDLLYRRISPEFIYNIVFSGQWSEKSLSEDIFLRYSEACYAGYSKEEKALLYQEISESCSEFERLYKYPKLPLNIGLVLYFSERLLDEVAGEPICRFSSLNQWRDCALLLGQDISVCAFFAHHDCQRLYGNREYFGWPATIRTDHHSLTHILERGIADNHRHLKGSTQLAELSWSALMNNPCEHNEDLVALDEFMQPVYSKGRLDNVWSTVDRVELAAILRAALFQSLRHEKHGEIARNIIEKHYIRKLERGRSVSDIVERLKVVYGKKIIEPDGSSIILDYALTGYVYEGCKKSPYRVLAGERSFLYDCFKAIMKGEFSTIDIGLFSLYLSLKTAFRGELVQVNREVGFYNFKRYQDRKDFSWDDTPYEWEAYRMAINGPLETQHIASLESRIAPRMSPDGNIRAVEKLDLSTKFAALTDLDQKLISLNGINLHKDAKHYGETKDYYVVHFIKDDDDASVPWWHGLKCRHQKLRTLIKKQSVALAKALCSSPYLCDRIRGIDACNKELNCRPEVFSHAFRYLTNISADNYPSSILISKCNPCLSRTYHVGEDFYSIVDGVRSIDEAINYLDLHQGDRLGHALALGVDPVLHCKCKSNVAVMPNQNNLDNLVWLLYRAPELGVDIAPSMHEKIRQRAEIAFRQIYGTAINKYGWFVGLQEYYDSMLLRGDDPTCYRSMRFVPPMPFEDIYRNYALRQSDIRLSSLRDDERIAGLYYLYHFGAEEKQRGLKTVRVATGPDEYELMRNVQEAMMEIIEDKGLIIECNPSSNVLIGTFKEYDQHPMFRFNHGALSWKRFENKLSHQLKICINTDDLGVFDTSIEFEYALVLRALEDQHNELGNRLFTTGEIDDYLCRLRDVGTAAVFPKMH